MAQHSYRVLLKSETLLNVIASTVEIHGEHLVFL
jgi:hypothetical protein